MSAISELTLAVGPEGGSARLCDLSLFVPPGAVDGNVTLVARLYTQKQRFPQVEISQQGFISPVLCLEPHGYQFKKPVLVRFPFTAVPEGWELVLLRADSLEAKSINECQQIVTYNTDTGEMTAVDCTFDVDRALLGVTYFCDYCYYGKRLTNSIKDKKHLDCSVFGYQPNHSRDRWILEVILHDHSQGIFKVFDLCNVLYDYLFVSL